MAIRDNQLFGLAIGGHIGKVNDRLLGINSKMVSLLLTQPSPRYLVEQMLPYDQVLQNLRSARYVESPVYKKGTSMRRVRLIVSEARQQARQVIIKSR